mmetsp:Transcript_93703/g.269897  ORF Transcript_93703/g.269897 Transcript_93703/m.269897 type:complete len:200 (-) Transcript_93703:9-608(-)
MRWLILSSVSLSISAKAKAISSILRDRSRISLSIWRIFSSFSTRTRSISFVTASISRLASATAFWRISIRSLKFSCISLYCRLISPVCSRHLWASFSKSASSSRIRCLRSASDFLLLAVCSCLYMIRCCKMVIFFFKKTICSFSSPVGASYGHVEDQLSAGGHPAIRAVPPATARAQRAAGGCKRPKGRPVGRAQTAAP